MLYDQIKTLLENRLAPALAADTAQDITALIASALGFGTPAQQVPAAPQPPHQQPQAPQQASPPAAAPETPAAPSGGQERLSSNQAQAARRRLAKAIEEGKTPDRADLQGILHYETTKARGKDTDLIAQCEAYLQQLDGGGAQSQPSQPAPSVQLPPPPPQAQQQQAQAPQPISPVPQPAQNGGQGVYVPPQAPSVQIPQQELQQFQQPQHPQQPQQPQQQPPQPQFQPPQPQLGSPQGFQPPPLQPAYSQPPQGIQPPPVQAQYPGQPQAPNLYTPPVNGGPLTSS